MNKSTELFIRSIMVLVIALALVNIAIPTPTAHAQTTALTGTIDASSACRLITTTYDPYDPIVFHVPTTGSYTFSHGSDTIAAAIAFVLYEEWFDPLQAWNTQASYVGFGNSVGASFTATLTADTTYIMVTSAEHAFGSLAQCEGRATTQSGNYVVNVSAPVILGEPSEPVVEPVVELLPGPDMVPLPEQAVVGTFTDWTPLYFIPATDGASDYHMAPGQSLWVAGLDATQTFYKVLLSGQWYWVPVGTIGPNYDNVWNGTPLPTDIVD